MLLGADAAETAPIGTATYPKAFLHIRYLYIAVDSLAERLDGRAARQAWRGDRNHSSNSVRQNPHSCSPIASG